MLASTERRKKLYKEAGTGGSRGKRCPRAGVEELYQKRRKGWGKLETALGRKGPVWATRGSNVAVLNEGGKNSEQCMQKREAAPAKRGRTETMSSKNGEDPTQQEPRQKRIQCRPQERPRRAHKRGTEEFGTDATLAKKRLFPEKKRQ